MKHRAGEFFAYARERHSITLRRAAGLPRGEWTKDRIMRPQGVGGLGGRFTCVFRELDKTTAWFRKYVRDPLYERPEVLLATVIFRMFNRIEVGEAIFCQNIIPLAGYPKRGVIDNSKNVTSFDMYLHSRDSRHLKRAIVGHVGPRGPYATGAYIISSPPGYSKLDGILRVIGMFNSDTHSFPELRSAAREVDWRTVAEQLREPGITLEATWRWLRQYDYLGGFHSYEIVTDLRHTALLNKAPDVMTWANVGPGARRGMNRVLGVDKNKRTSDEDVQDGMRLLLKMSRLRENWPQKKDWPAWELRDVEHTLCEFDKYERMRTGEGRSRGVYR